MSSIPYLSPSPKGSTTATISAVATAVPTTLLVAVSLSLILVVTVCIKMRSRKGNGSSAVFNNQAYNTDTTSVREDQQGMSNYFYGGKTTRVTIVNEFISKI